MTPYDNVSIRALLRQSADEIDKALTARLEALPDVPDILAESMRYSVHAGGKRLRPALVLWTHDLCGGDRTDVWPAAIAIECIHTFSLVHDDLPCVDDDSLRRGLPTNHCVYGEACALLAGDGLMALAFEIIANDTRNVEVIRQCVLELARATGPAGMIGGEYEDLAGQQRLPDVALVRRIHEAKTARLIQAACRMGALSAGASAVEMEAVTEYGLHLGFAFQIADDLLDETGTAARVGKQTGKDAAVGKQTLSRVMGIDAARQKGIDEADRAVRALHRFGDRAAPLAALARYAVERES